MCICMGACLCVRVVRMFAQRSPVYYSVNANRRAIVSVKATKVYCSAGRISGIGWQTHTYAQT